MSKYTTELRYVCAMFSNLDPEVDDYRDVIRQSVHKVFNFDFPIFDEDHRLELETKILKHYYFREIGCETVGQWRMRLDTKLNEIMPYYNEMYKSLDYLKEPLTDTDYKRIITGTTGEQREEKNKSTQGTSTENTGTVTDVSQGTNTYNKNQWDKYSDTPQGTLTNVKNNQYLTNARQLEGTDTTQSNDTNTRTNNLKGNSNTNGTFDTEGSTTGQHETTETVKGKMSSVSIAKVVQEYRKAILNIDMQIVHELADLFMLVY